MPRAVQSPWRSLVSLCGVVWLLGARAAAQETPPDGQLLLPTEELTRPLDSLVQPNPIPAESAMQDQPTLFPRDSAAARTSIPPAEQRTVPMGTPVPNSNLDDFGAGAASSFGYNPGADGLARPSMVGAQADRERQRLMARAERQSSLEHYNVKIGPIPFRFGAGIEMSFTDNANLSRSDKLADLTLIPTLNMFGGIRLTPWNTLSIQLGVGYIWNLNRKEFNRVLTNAGVGLDTDSGLNFDFNLGSFRINVYDRPAIPRQQFDLITQRNFVVFSQFTNVAGVSVMWNVNTRLSTSFQYDYLTVFALSSEVEEFDQSSQMLSASVNYRVSDGLTLGLQGSASFVDYKQSFLNDVQSYNAGVNLSSAVTRNITLRMSAGYQVGVFGSGGSVADASQLGSFFYQFGINHSINRLLNHSISLGREAQLGTASNSTSIDFVRYQISGNFWRNFGLGANASLDSAKESGGAFAQDFSLLQLGLNGFWIPSRKMSLSFGYRFIKRDASAQGSVTDQSLDYIENRVDLSLQFNL